MKKENGLLFVLFGFLCIFGYLIYKLPIKEIFTNTAITGGDTGTHLFVAYYAQKIFPALKGWCFDWYSGFPFLYFYPPLLYFVNTIVSFVLNFNISLKIVTLLGSFMLPICAYFSLKCFGLKKYACMFGSLVSICFLFITEFQIYGGNFPSTLAGEFSYSFAFALFFLFIGTLYKGVKENKYVFLNILILSLMVLSHPFAVMVAVIYAISLIFLEKDYLRRFKYLAYVFLFGFLITAFFSIPFLTNHAYVSAMNWQREIIFSNIFPVSVYVVLPFTLFGVIYAIIKKDKRVLPICGLIISSLILFLIINNFSIWNTRFLPFIIMGYLFIGAYGAGEFILWFKKEWLRYLWAGVFIIGGLIFVDLHSEYLESWFNWNYTGYEDKEVFVNQAIPLFEFLKELPQGRVMWEYRGEYDAYGTPRFLENIPMWTGKPTFEGLLIESSVWGPFHFTNQGETTTTPTSAIAGFDYPRFNFEKGVRHLQKSGARYFVAYTREIKDLARLYMYELRDLGDFSVYLVPGYSMVEGIESFEIKKKSSDWIDDSFDWYVNGELDKPIVYCSGKECDELKEYDKEYDAYFVSGYVEGNNKIKFQTSRIGQPHIVKVSYFPGWEVKNALGPYLISPSYMMVIPLEENVEMRFTGGFWQKTSNVISLLSLGCFIYLWKKNKKIKF